MLTLTRRIGSSVYLTTAAGEVIEILVLEAIPGTRKVKLGFRAPQSTNICREEVMAAQRVDRLRADLAAQEAADRQRDLANIDAGEG